MKKLNKKELRNINGGVSKTTLAIAAGCPPVGLFLIGYEAGKESD